MSKPIDNIFRRTISRRNFFYLSAGLAGDFFLSQGAAKPVTKSSKVAVIRVPDYSLGIKNIIKPYFEQFELSLNKKTVLLKPNLVDYHDNDHHIFTHPTIMIAAIELFQDLGAKVIIAEASGLRRDMNTILHYSGYKQLLDKYSVEFVDLNLDHVEKVKIPFRFTGLRYFYIPRSILEADFIVSIPKLKTHHWLGVTLSLKNMLGILPGTKYGWPKNRLHTLGADKSVLDINHTIKADFAIIDGVYGIEGNGPLFGENRYVGAVIMSDDLLAADTVASKIMGVNPQKVDYLRVASQRVNQEIPPLGNMKSIKIIGATINSIKQNFKLLDEFKFLR